MTMPTESGGASTLRSVFLSCSSGRHGPNQGNFEITLTNGIWSTAKAPVTATAGNYSGIYDGVAHAPTGCVVTGGTRGASRAQMPGFCRAGCGLGVVAPVVSGPNQGNFEITVTDGTWSIAKAPVTATAGSYSGTYDGTAHSTSACTVAGTYKGDLTCTNNPSPVGPDVGSGTVTPNVTGTGLDNFHITSVNGLWEIKKAPVTATAGSYSGIYDGVAHEPTGCAVTGAYTGVPFVRKCPTSVGPGVGSGTVAPVINDNSNFAITRENGFWSIAAAPIRVTAVDKSKNYDGHAFTRFATAIDRTQGRWPVATGADLTQPQ